MAATNKSLARSRHRVEAARLALSLRPIEGLAEIQEPGGTGGAPRGGGGLGEGKRVKNPKRLQRLATGITVRQDFRDCARMVFYDTGNSHWRYATHGGTAFVVVFRGRPYAFTCNHVLKNFEWRQLVITNTKVGRKIAGLQSVAYPTQPHHAAEDTDIVDLVVIEFAPDVTATFFKDTAYILDSSTATTSQLGDQLYVAGALKEKVNMGEGIRPGFCCIEFVDSGADSSDPTLRNAQAA